jgi:hypothetical protein
LAELRPLLDPQTAGLPIAKESGYTVGTSLYVYASWVTTMARLMHDFPGHFPDTRDPNKPKVASGFAAEDCYRAFQVLRMYWRSTTGVRASTKMGTKTQNQVAVVPQFFTAQEDEVAPDKAHPAEVLIKISDEIHAEDEDGQAATLLRLQKQPFDSAALDMLDKELASRAPPGKSSPPSRPLRAKG